jgi:hypothetical protein
VTIEIRVLGFIKQDAFSYWPFKLAKDHHHHHHHHHHNNKFLLFLSTIMCFRKQMVLQEGMVSPPKIFSLLIYGPRITHCWVGWGGFGTSNNTNGAFTLDVKSVLNENLGGILDGTQC